MPGCHAGEGCIIGLTVPITEAVVGHLVGVDIDCGMEVVKVANKELNYKKLDNVITNKIPAGRKIRQKVHPYFETLNLEALRCWHALSQHQDRVQFNLGSLEGANHLIKANKGEDGSHYVVIHSRSRQILSKSS